MFSCTLPKHTHTKAVSEFALNLKVMFSCTLPKAHSQNFRVKGKVFEKPSTLKVS